MIWQQLMLRAVPGSNGSLAAFCLNIKHGKHKAEGDKLFFPWLVTPKCANILSSLRGG